MKTNVKIESIEPKPRKLRNHHALNKLKNYIIENNLKIGDRIPTETELCERFQVSRVSVREATKALSLLGVLKSKPRRGTVLNEPDISGVNELISFHFASANYTKHELLELRLIIEVGQLKYAIDNMTKETYQQCMDIITDLDVENLSRKEWLLLDMQFHTSLMKLGENRAIRSMATMLRKFFHVAFKDIRGARRGTVINEHKMIVNALYEKNLDLAQGLMHQHLKRSLLMDHTDDNKVSSL